MKNVMLCSFFLGKKILNDIYIYIYYIYIYIYIYIRGAFDEFPDILVQAFKIVVDS